MSLRARLTLWFLLLALVPGVFLSVFVLRQLVATVEWWDSAGAEDALTSSVSVGRASLGHLEADLRRSARLPVELARQRPLDLAPGSSDRMMLQGYLSNVELDFFQVYRRVPDGWARALTITRTDSSAVARGLAARADSIDLAPEFMEGAFTTLPIARSGDTWAFALVDTLRADSLRPSDELVAVGYALPTDFFRDFSAMQLGMGIFRQLSIYGEVYQTWYRVIVIVALLLIAVVAVVAARSVERQISRPVDALVGGFARVDGDAALHLEPGGTPELRRLTESFNEMTARLARARADLAAAERAAAWQGVARQVAHEIRNPLTTITLALENLSREFAALETEGRQRGQKSVDALRREFDALTDLADSFYALGALPEVRPGRVDLNALVESLVALQPWPHVALDAELDPARPLARGDERQLRRVLRNLVKNACEAQPGGGRVTIATRSGDAPGTVVVEVRDDGPGMDAEVAAQAFDPGFSTKGRGSGVGLTVSRRVVEQHGGTLAIESAPGRGTRVTVALPAHAEASA